MFHSVFRKKRTCKNESRPIAVACCLLKPTGRWGLFVIPSILCFHFCFVKKNVNRNGAKWGIADNAIFFIFD